MSTPMIATRAAGLQSLAAFVPRAGRAYADGRNVDAGPDQPRAVSGLSPYVRHRLLTEAEVVDAVLQRHTLSAAEKFVQEVCWRTYWKGWLQQRPQAWRDYVAARDAHLLRLQQISGLRLGYTQACEGRTGIDCFDAWAQELVATGTLHNHTRMWFASIWIFTLRLPWELGADWFMRHLADADAASNTLSWRWVAGLHTVGKHYVARAENIERYTRGRFNPVGQLNESAAPLTAPPPYARQPLATLPSDDPRTPSALLLTDDDLSAGDLWPAAAPPPRAIAVFRGGIAARSPQPLGAVASAFANAAIDDAMARLRQRWPDSVVVEPEALAETGAQQIRMAEAPVGPGADALPTLPLPVVAQRRDWDAAFWPHATRGFFQLRERIPQILGR